MRITIIGYGKMGKAVEKVALEHGHTISHIIDDETDYTQINSRLALSTDVVVEFTTPASAKKNIYECISNGIPVISGTTGWEIDTEEISVLCEKYDTAMFYSSNFSIGMNVFMAINEKLANLLNRFPDYIPAIEETHHIHKLDKPSGTAITLAEGIINNHSSYNGWKLNSQHDIQNIGIASFREGEITGDHKVIWENDIDTITIEHSAKNRTGLALGAVLASEFILGKKGFFTMKDLLNL